MFIKIYCSICCHVILVLKKKSTNPIYDVKTKLRAFLWLQLVPKLDSDSSSYDRTYKQTNRDYNFMHRFKYLKILPMSVSASDTFSLHFKSSKSLSSSSLPSLSSSLFPSSSLLLPSHSPAPSSPCPLSDLELEDFLLSLLHHFHSGCAW